MGAVYIIALVVMDLLAVVNCELVAAWLGILACDSADKCIWLSMRLLNKMLQFLEKANFI
jgi:hypothetical protein